MDYVKTFGIPGNLGVESGIRFWCHSNSTEKHI